LMGVVAIVGLAALTIGILLLWIYGLLTGFVFAVAILAIEFALYQMKLLDIEKYPTLGLVAAILPIAAFLIGVVGERAGAFLVTPLIQKELVYTPPPMLAEPTIEAFVGANLEIVLLLIIIVAVTLGWLYAQKD